MNNIKLLEKNFTMICIIALLYCFCLFGCASRPLDDPIYSITAQKVTSNIVIMKTTRAEIHQLFGKPTHRANSYVGNKRGETWVYGGSYVTGTLSSSWRETHCLRINFAGDLVASYKYIEDRDDESINIEMP